MNQVITVVIVEDEKASQDYLFRFLQTHFPQIQVVAIADSLVTATEALKRLQPDLVFLDVEIKMGTSFDVLAAVPDLKAEIIFTTAFNTFAIDAFRHHAFDYLLKPLEDKSMIDSVQRCLVRLNQQSASNQIVQLLQTLQSPTIPKRLGVQTLEGIEFVDADDILFAEAKGNYTELRLADGSKLVTSRKLKEVEQALPVTAFFRIHHSYVVNTRYIKKYLRGRGGSVLLTNEMSLPVSVARKDDFLKWLGQE
jgi:two-component system LytT family response regulator